MKGSREGQVVPDLEDVTVFCCEARWCNADVEGVWLENKHSRLKTRRGKEVP